MTRPSPLRGALDALSLASPLLGAALAMGPTLFGLSGMAWFALGMLGYHALPFAIQPPNETLVGDERTWIVGTRSQVGFAARVLGIATWHSLPLPNARTRKLASSLSSRS